MNRSLVNCVTTRAYFNMIYDTAVLHFAALIADLQGERARSLIPLRIKRLVNYFSLAHNHIIICNCDVWICGQK
jgi:hypothetical protein